MQYGTDCFEFRRQALLKSRQPLDFTYETSVTGLQIGGTEPEGCSRRIIFKIDDKFYRFVNGTLDRYDERGEFDDILNYGNTVGELLALNTDSLKSFVGKRVYPVFALDAPADSPVMPSVKISATVNSYNDVYTKIEYSPVYELKRSGDACKISEISDSKTLNGYGTATVKCKLKNPVTGWSDDWLNLADAQNRLATALQFQIQYVITTLDGIDFARVNSVDVIYTTDSEKLSGDTTEIVTLAQDYPYGNLATCYAMVKHSELIDCNARAFVTFGEITKKRVDLPLGTATGSEQTVTLDDMRISPDSFHLEIGNRNCTDFYFDTSNRTVTFTGRAGDTVTISYEYGSGDGNWYEMGKDLEYNNEGVFSTRFTYRFPSGSGKPASAVKFVFEKISGHVTNQRLGTGTGKTQAFYIPHKAKIETIQCTGSWKYDEVAQILRVIAPIDELIIISYEWIGSIPTVFGYIAGWQPALRKGD